MWFWVQLPDEDEKKKKKEQDAAELRIAWQYRKYIPKIRESNLQLELAEHSASGQGDSAAGASAAAR